MLTRTSTTRPSTGGTRTAGHSPASRRHAPSRRRPAVGVYLVDRRDVRTSDGLVVTGFDFMGWTEGDGTRVQVFVLAPRKGAPNTYMPNGDPDLLERRDFASYRILSDQGIGIQEMRSPGIEPMILSSRQVVPSPLAVQLEQVRQAVQALRRTKP